MTRQELLDIGFNELPHFTVMNSIVYDLGRKRFLSVSGLGTPNEMIFIQQVDYKDVQEKNITDLIVFKNYDYDGCTNIETLKLIITAFTGRIF